MVNEMSTMEASTSGFWEEGLGFLISQIPILKGALGRMGCA
jgi:hypothetical protein